MIDVPTIELLQKHIRVTGRSLLQYINQSFPWTSNAKDVETVKCLNQMAEKEQEIAAKMSKFLVKLRTNPPHLFQFPMHFTSFNFLNVDRLLALLEKDQSGAVAELESDLSPVQDKEAIDLLTELLDTKKEHLQTINELRTQPAPANA